MFQRRSPSLPDNHSRSRAGRSSPRCSTSGCRLSWMDVCAFAVTTSSRARSSGSGSTLARRLFACRPITRAPSVDGRSGRSSGRGTTCGCGMTLARRPHCCSMSAAAAVVRVITSSAAGNQHIEMFAVPGLVDEMRIGQVVHGQHQRASAVGQLCRPAHQVGGSGGVEPEMQMGEIEFPVVLRHPSGLQHHRRPPLPGQRIDDVRRRVGQPDDPIIAIGQGKVTHVGVVGRDGGHPDRAGPDQGRFPSEGPAAGCRYVRGYDDRGHHRRPNPTLRNVLRSGSRSGPARPPAAARLGQLPGRGDPGAAQRIEHPGGGHRPDPAGLRAHLVGRRTAPPAGVIGEHPAQPTGAGTTTATCRWAPGRWPR